MSVLIKRLNKNLPLPSYQTRSSAGMDLYASIEKDIRIAPGERILIPTGISLALSPDLEAQVRPRSGLALKHGITVLNTPGTIDADYRGEIGVILFNTDDYWTFIIHPGDRIAQLVIAPVMRIDWDEVAELPAADRGKDGFGSTGV